jgi:hypothetical protein
MKQPKQLLYHSLALLAALALTAPALAGDQVPFKGTETNAGYAGTATQQGQYLIFTGASPEVGVGTVVGRHTVYYTLVIDLVSGNASGDAWLTAASGDQIHFLFNGGPPLPPDFNQTIVSATIVGGTGRFEGATGSFTVHSRYAYSLLSGIDPDPEVNTYEGWISRPGSRQK